MPLSGIPLAASAALNCTSSNPQNGSFSTSIRDVFIAPEDFSTLPVGEPVSLVRFFTLSFACTITAGTPQFGIGSAAVPGAYPAPGFSNNMMTTAQLHSIGLGYRASWHTRKDGSMAPNDTPLQSLTSVTTTTPPVYWLTPSPQTWAAGSFTTRAEGRVQFYKIGPIPDTDGVRVTANFAENLLSLYIADSAAPFNITGLIHFAWNSSTFVSKVRACTPTLLGPNPNFVNLGTVTPSGTPAPGTVLVEQPFTLTFNCPYMAFERIGFRFDPVYGTQSQTIMNTKPGTGMATGVGIRLKLDMSDVSDTGTYTTVNYNQNHAIPNFNRPDWPEVSDAALTETLSRTIQFKAELLRINGVFAPGRVESALIIVMRYK